MNILNPNIYNTVIAIYAILAISFIVTKILEYKTKTKKQELNDRIISWLWMISIFVLAMFLNNTLGVVFLAFVSYLAFKEYISIIPTRLADRRIIFYGYLSIIPQYYFAYTQWYAMFIITIPVYLFLFLSFRQMMIGQTEGFIDNTSKVNWGAMLFIFAISHSAYLFMLKPIGDINGAMLLLYLFLLTELNDVLQFVCGKTFGKTPIVPKVSPKKTVEGLVGAVIITTTLAVLFSYLTPFSIIQAIGAGLIISLSGFIGDVVVSMIKRDVGVKDASNFIAGHGGVIDRVDSLTYTAPLFFHYIYYIFY
ncbi:putative phosphatidate cytidylyltransferase [Sulfurovum sp. enrichment culture clone C5]|uniref:Putative phosphatidate cytidylyltransferase n=1 Tax=Sulfurovum sp. enrichment culture clone C5 TaxID=497650 RepID=A0A0S4XN31_9BACT|nr:putative phosphatidate cytidylyltransferase [Sulfurovum sp. enrichment culture clone C5]